MRKTRLKSLSGVGFRTFKEAFSLQFPENGLVLLRGLNHETQGGSGSGKTNLLLGIAHGFSYCPLPATELLNWNSKSYEVTVSLENDLGSAELRRSSKGASFQGPGVQTTGRAVDPAVEAYVGLSSEMLGLLTYRQQRSGGVFISMRDSEKKAFLTKLLQLEKFEEQLESSKKKLSDLEKRRDVQQELSAVAVVALEHLNSQQLPPILEVDRALEEQLAALNVDALKSKVATAQQNLAAYQASVSRALREVRALFETREEPLRGQIVERRQPQVDRTKYNELHSKLQLLNAKLKQVTDADTLKARGVRSQRMQLEADIDQLKGYLSELPLIRVRLASAAKDLEALLAQTCPTCSQPWVRQMTERLVLEDKIKDYKARLAEEPSNRAALDRMKSDLDSLVHVADPMLEKLAEVKRGIERQMDAEEASFEQAKRLQAAEDDARRAQARAQLAELQRECAEQCAAMEASPELAQHRRDVQELTAALSEETLKTNKLASDLHIQKVMRANAEQRHAEHRKAVDLAAEESRSKKARLEEMKAMCFEEMDFIAMVKDFLGLIFDEVLAEIADETNRILGRIPNTNHMTVEFVSEATNQKGEVRKEIQTVVMVGEQATTAKAGCSGGQYGVVELATDLALGEIISRRTGVAPGWLILDEALDGLGRVEKEACLEMLQDYARERLVLVIDHDTAFKEMFSKYVDVDFERGESTAKLVTS